MKCTRSAAVEHSFKTSLFTNSRKSQLVKAAKECHTGKIDFHKGNS